MESGEWYILGRNKLESYEEFAVDAERMSRLADVFPMIFFLVAALSSLTTMTRMVEEHRTQIGSMKAMGFSGSDIRSRFPAMPLRRAWAEAWPAGSPEFWEYLE